MMGIVRVIHNNLLLKIERKLIKFQYDRIFTRNLIRNIQSAQKKTWPTCKPETDV